MRGANAMQESLSTVAKLDDVVPGEHALRAVGQLVNAALVEMNGRFNKIYVAVGRGSIAPDRLVLARPSRKSLRPEHGSDDQHSGGGGRNAQAAGEGKPRSNDAHASTTDPDACVCRKSHKTEVVLCCQGHALMENRSGLVVGAVDTAAHGFGGRRAAVGILDALPATSSRHSVGADKGCDTADFVAACRDRNVMPHIACNDTRIGGSAIDGRTASHSCHRLSPIVCKRTGEHLGRARTVRQIVFRRLERIDQRRAHPPRVCAIDATTQLSSLFRHFSPACQGA